MRSGLLAGIRWSVCMLKSHRSLCESFSRTGVGLCIYHLFVWSSWNLLLLLLFYSFESFSHQRLMMAFRKSLSDNMSPQVYTTPLSIIAYFKNAFVWIVSSYSRVFQSLSNISVILPSVPITITIVITVTFVLLCFFIIIIIYSLEFFTSVLSDGLSLGFEWPQVSSSLHDSSQYSGRSQ